MKKIFLFTLFLLALSFSAYALPFKEKPEIKLYFSENPIFLDTPIIEVEKTLLVPLNNVVPHLSGDLQYNRKSDTYILTLDKEKTIEIIPNSTQFLLGNQTHFFPEKAYLYKTRIYVPLSVFLETVGFKIEKKGVDLYVSPIAEPPKPAVSTINTSANVLFSIEHDSVTPSAIPKLLPQHPLFLGFSGKTFPLTGRWTYVQNKLYVVLDALFKYQNYTLIPGKEGLKLEKAGTQIYFEPGKLEYTLIQGKSVQKVPIQSPIEKIKGDYYFPLESFVKSLNYTTRWSPKESTIHIVNLIQTISFIKETDGYHLRISGVQPVSVSPTYILRDPHRLFWDIPDSEIAFKNRVIPLSEGPFKKFSVAQHESGARVVFEVDGDPKFLLKASSTQLEIIFPIEKPSLDPQNLLKPTGKSVQTLTPKSEPNYLENKVIFIDPGHGGSDPGASGANGEQEKDITLAISLALQKLLQEKGAKVHMSRTTDKNPTLEERSKEPDQKHADVLLSIHINSFIKPFANGTETYYYKPEDRLVAETLHRELVRSLKFKDGGVRRGMMYVLHHSQTPGALIEPCFITNPKEHDFLVREESKQKIAEALLTGLQNYFKIKSSRRHIR